jgi:hypothetical protein
LRAAFTCSFHYNHLDALKTALKILDNVIARPGDFKVRSLRCGNPAFQSKLGRFAGGVALLASAGFEQVMEAGVPHLQLPPHVESVERTTA